MKTLIAAIGLTTLSSLAIGVQASAQTTDLPTGLTTDLPTGSTGLHSPVSTAAPTDAARAVKILPSDNHLARFLAAPPFDRLGGATNLEALQQSVGLLEKQIENAEKARQNVLYDQGTIRHSQVTGRVFRDEEFEREKRNHERNYKRATQNARDTFLRVSNLKAQAESALNSTLRGAVNLLPRESLLTEVAVDDAHHADRLSWRTAIDFFRGGLKSAQDLAVTNRHKSMEPNQTLAMLQDIRKEMIALPSGGLPVDGELQKGALVTAFNQQLGVLQRMAKEGVTLVASEKAFKEHGAANGRALKSFRAAVAAALRRDGAAAAPGEPVTVFAGPKGFRIRPAVSPRGSVVAAAAAVALQLSSGGAIAGQTQPSEADLADLDGDGADSAANRAETLRPNKWAGSAAGRRKVSN